MKRHPEGTRAERKEEDMKRFIIGIFVLILITLSLGGCGASIANDPIEVVDNVKVGMTRAQVEEVVDVKYFQSNRSWRGLMISDVKITDKGYSYTVAEDQWAMNPYWGMFFFSVTSDIDAALVVFTFHETDETLDRVYAIGVIPFARAKEIVCKDGWRLRD